MSAVRPLPPRPSLEFEHKEAKAFLRRLRSGDPDAVARATAQHPTMASVPSAARLADAQLVIAREYGFASWPKLVRYFGDTDRQSKSLRTGEIRPRDFCEERVRRLIARHGERDLLLARQLARYVPRFYGAKLEEIVASSPLTEEEARLVVARGSGFPSWHVLLERIAAHVPHEERHIGEVDPRRYVAAALQAADLEELKHVVRNHPDLLHTPKEDVAKGMGILTNVVHFERELGREAMRPIVEWLATQGLDLQDELNRQLCGHLYMKTEKVRWLLERGADPNWIAPNSVPVLEHALMQYWNGEAVDLVAARAVPRKALWISAGLGDVRGVSRFLDRHGKPTADARRIWPDFDAVIKFAMTHPDPDDEEILVEAFAIAMFNGRTEILEYMVSRGFPIDSMVWGAPLVCYAVGNAWLPVAECLIRCGADLDLQGHGFGPPISAREMARDRFLEWPNNQNLRSLAELCGMDPDALVAAHNAQPPGPLSYHPMIEDVLALAGDDAFQLGQSDIQPENLLFGILRVGAGDIVIREMSLAEQERFFSDARDRLRDGKKRLERPKLPFSPETQALIRAVDEDAVKRRREWVTIMNLIYVLTRDEEGPVANLLAKYGASAVNISKRLESGL